MEQNEDKNSVWLLQRLTYFVLKPRQSKMKVATQEH